MNVRERENGVRGSARRRRPATTTSARTAWTRSSPVLSARQSSSTVGRSTPCMSMMLWSEAFKHRSMTWTTFAHLTLAAIEARSRSANSGLASAPVLPDFEAHGLKNLEVIAQIRADDLKGIGITTGHALRIKIAVQEENPQQIRSRTTSAWRRDAHLEFRNAALHCVTLCQCAVHVPTVMLWLFAIIM